MNVHCLATCLRPDRFGAVELLFHTVRKGFPSSNILVYGNGLSPEISHYTQSCCRAVGAQFMNIPVVSHGQWLEQLVATERDPFWVTDSDIVFFDKVEHWFDSAGSDVLYSGRLEPKFFEPWTSTIHVERLHPSLLWINPQLLRAALRSYPHGREFLSTVTYEPFKWQMITMRDGDKKKVYFYDTTAGLYHSIDGQPFTDEQNAAFEHLLCGTYSHMLTDHNNLQQVHDEIFRHPYKARGLKVSQDKWYADNAVKG